MKKLLIVLGIILGIFIVILIANFTIFSLKNVNITFHNQTTKFQNVEVQNQIIENADFQKQSVFFLDKQKYVEKLEKQNPFLEVVNLEINFPNSITIHCLERTPFFSLISNEQLFVYDKEMKLLEIQNQNQFTSTQENEIQLENFVSNCCVGEFETFENVSVLKNVYDAFSQNNKTQTDVKSLVKSMQVKVEASILNCENTPTLVWKDFLGNEINIKDAHQKLAEKIFAYFDLQEKMTLSVTSKIIVYENLNGQIVAQQISE